MNSAVAAAIRQLIESLDRLLAAVDRFVEGTGALDHFDRIIKAELGKGAGEELQAVLR